MASQRDRKKEKEGTKQIGESKGEEESRQDSVILNDNHRIRDMPWLCRREDENRRKGEDDLIVEETGR